jgi:hypothetical protein
LAAAFLAGTALAFGFSSSEDSSSEESSLDTTFLTTAFYFSSFFGYFSVVFLVELASDVALPLF